MVKLLRKFLEGDKVFAKVRGYPPWPARIDAVTDANTKNAKYNVFFYGTGETAVCKVEELFAYAEHKAKFGKPLKRKFFHEGLQQLEAEVISESTKQKIGSGESKESAVPEEARAKGGDAPTEAHTTDAADSDAEGGALVIDEGEKKKPVKRKAPITPATPAATAVRPLTPSSNQDTPETKKKRGGRGKNTPAAIAETTPKRDVAAPETQGEESPGKEVISRSGRKIKPKRFADFSSSEETEAVADKNENTASPKVRGKGKVEDTAEKEVSPSSGTNRKILAAEKRSAQVESEGMDVDSLPTTASTDIHGRFLLARTFAGEYVGIKLDVDRPKIFESDKARAQWDWASARSAMKLKGQLENGSILPEQVKDALDFNVNVAEDEKRLLAKDGAVHRKKYKLRWLRLESQLLQLDALIKSNLGLDRADADKCLQAMDDLLALPIDPLMLKKHPHIVETVKRLRRYIGNLADWKLNEEEASIFKQKAEQIRQKAEHIYNKFKVMFTISEGQSFWQSFSDQVVHFKELTKDMTEETMFSLMADPTRPDAEMSLSAPLVETDDLGEAKKVAEPEVEAEPESTANATLTDPQAK